MNHNIKKSEIRDAEIDALLREFNGNHREAIRALLYDLAVLARDHSEEVSCGYVRGQLWQFKSSVAR
jgi:hypothetical protein